MWEIFHVVKEEDVNIFILCTATTNKPAQRLPYRLFRSNFTMADFLECLTTKGGQVTKPCADLFMQCRMFRLQPFNEFHFLGVLVNFHDVPIRVRPI
jgi:hypothetical protein